MLQLLKLFCQLLLFVSSVALGHAEPMLADDTLPAALSCPIAKAYDQDHIPVYFLHHQFPDGSQDLVIAIHESAAEPDIKRVTFSSGGPDCLAKYLAIARGGNWGWHLLWQPEGTSVLRYARMDGEAWVTSPAKKLATQAHPVNQPLILTLGQQVWVVWIEIGEAINNIYAVYSDDEGRNWQEARLIAQTGKVPSSLSLIEKENIPYLAGQGLAEPLPLLSK